MGVLEEDQRKHTPQGDTSKLFPDHYLETGWADWRAQSFSDMLCSSLPTVCNHSKQGSLCVPAPATILFLWYCGGSKPLPFKPVFSTNPTPKDTEDVLQRYSFEFLLPWCNALCPNYYYYSKPEKTSYLTWQLRRKNLSQKDLLTFHIDKWEEHNHTPLKKMEICKNILWWAVCDLEAVLSNLLF